MATPEGLGVRDLPTNMLVTWAQRSSEDDADKCYVSMTVVAPDVTEPTIKLTNDEMHYQGKDKQGKEYTLHFEFYETIDAEKSKYHVTDRNATFHLQKHGDPKIAYWPRLTKQKARLHWLKTDFEKWVDEDEQEAKEEDPMAGMGGMPGMPGMPGMGGMGGMPGMGGMGGPGGLDFSQLAGMSGLGGDGDGGEGADSDDEDAPDGGAGGDEEMPALEEQKS